MTPITYEEFESLEEVVSGKANQRKVDWDELKKKLFGKAWTVAEIATFTPEFALIPVEDFHPKEKTPVRRMRVRNWCDSEVKKGNAIKKMSGKGVMYAFPEKKSKKKEPEPK